MNNVRLVIEPGSGPYAGETIVVEQTGKALDLEGTTDRERIIDYLDRFNDTIGSESIDLSSDQVFVTDDRTTVDDNAMQVAEELNRLDLRPHHVNIAASTTW
jgi:hypothetical protein